MGSGAATAIYGDLPKRRRETATPNVPQPLPRAVLNVGLCI